MNLNEVHACSLLLMTTVNQPLLSSPWPSRVFPQLQHTVAFSPPLPSSPPMADPVLSPEQARLNPSRAPDLPIQASNLPVPRPLSLAPAWEVWAKMRVALL